MAELFAAVVGTCILAVIMVRVTMGEQEPPACDFKALSAELARAGLPGVLIPTRPDALRIAQRGRGEGFDLVVTHYPRDAMGNPYPEGDEIATEVRRFPIRRLELVR